ncbi:hypothetical protein J5N97_030137 [Dioscorea zingiberensis]|uniref:Uncharacterized protein n=1 Tax=Dioscorea zingiberensis TaxID=325984 RepID=A0A9D5BX79_9LILI|nr:hypothetical protein J5N97_030137 [Dioscorea zingiberensis]
MLVTTHAGDKHRSRRGRLPPRVALVRDPIAPSFGGILKHFRSSNLYVCCDGQFTCGIRWLQILKRFFLSDGLCFCFFSAVIGM